MKSRTIKVDYLARVEGEGGILVKVKDDQVTEVKLNIFEPPRFFEAWLRGRLYKEVPDLTARICGICPVAYQMSSCHAIESAFGQKPDGMIRELRRLLYCGEWIESHSLHIHLLHAPDFLGYQDALAMAKDFPKEVERGLRIKKLGNDIMTTVGGREIHPINVRVGGFYKSPSKKDIRAYIEPLKKARDEAVETLRLMATLKFPNFEQDYVFVSLRHPTEYPLCEGNVVSSNGLNIPVSDYEKHFQEEHIPHANALHSKMLGTGAYLVGPLARYALNYDRLTPLAQSEAKKAGLEKVVKNPFKGIVVRAVELLWAIEEALRICESYEVPEKPFIEMTPKASMGSGMSEAPRGILYHRYRLDENGYVLDAKITPPTSQNQKQMEDDLRAYVEQNLDQPHDKLTWQCEQAIRNYDPCISCATHAIRLDILRD
ncbi:MAG TPA: Ni/Fe hydrogenase subunit alpha [bacterium]|jgi:coenzyme F420-reducing hydrogenase alpha subunit